MKPYTVLIVDDDEAQHEILGTYLERAGYVVRHAYNGRAGLAAAREHRPDLILLDLIMPEMDGFQSLAAMQADPNLGASRVLFITSHSQRHLKIKGLELGAEDYITKPFEKSELLARIRAALRRSARYERSAHTVEGHLADLDLTELLQTFGLRGKPAVIDLLEMRATITLSNGHLVGAEFGAHRGEEALRRILVAARGAFRVSFPATVAAEGGKPLQAALMDGVVALDEMVASVRPHLPLDGVVEVGATAPTDAWAVLSGQVLPVRELLARSPVPLREAPAAVADAIARGVLTPLPGPKGRLEKP